MAALRQPACRPHRPSSRSPFLVSRAGRGSHRTSESDEGFSIAHRRIIHQSGAVVASARSISTLASLRVVTSAFRPCDNIGVTWRTRCPEATARGRCGFYCEAWGAERACGPDVSRRRRRPPVPVTHPTCAEFGTGDPGMQACRSSCARARRRSVPVRIHRRHRWRASERRARSRRAGAARAAAATLDSGHLLNEIRLDPASPGRQPRSWPVGAASRPIPSLPGRELLQLVPVGDLVPKTT